MDIALDSPAPAAAAKRPRPRSNKRSIPMVVKLAYRNLFHDRLSFAVTIVGIVFSSKVNDLVAQGDLAGAARASSNARTWAIVATVLAVTTV